MKFTAAGDVLIQKRMPKNYEGFDEIKNFIEQGDVRFFNLETTVNYEGECYGFQHSGGTYVRTTPEALGDVQKYGFNMTSFNNNHLIDFGYEGILKTIEYVDKSGLVHAGVGKNMGQAAAPQYYETENGRVALIAVNSSFNPVMIAGEQSRRLPGRPGLNPIRHDKIIVIPEEDFRRIEEISEKTNYNAAKNISRAEGYTPKLADGVCELGDIRFRLGDEYATHTYCNKEDLERVKKSIEEAKLQADYVMISVHSHDIAGTAKENPAEFLEEFAHFCIDNGADAIVGHGPHLLRPIEVYKEKPIFYSLGDFIIQLYDVPVAPEDFYKKYGMNSDNTVAEVLKKRSANYTRGLMEDKRMLEAVIPYWETDENNNLTKLVLKPICASKGEGHHLEGLPKPVEGTEFIEKLAKISAPYGVKITMENGLAKCEW